MSKAEAITLRGRMYAGRFIGGAVARQLRDFIHDEGLRGHVEWDPGWPTGTVRFRISGPEDDVNACYAAIKRWADRK